MNIQEFISIGWSNGWWFTAIFGLVNLFFLMKYPRCFSKRLLRFPPFKSKFDKVISMISVVLFMRGIMVYTLFVTIKIGTILFYVGLIVYVIGLILYTGAMGAYATTEIQKPVVTGVYRVSRHPMQVFSLFMWVGVGLATHSWIILAICCVQPFLSYWFLKAQEEYCLVQYGEMYRDYLQNTPRYLGI